MIDRVDTLTRMLGRRATPRAEKASTALDTRVLTRRQGMLESLAFTLDGRLLFTSISRSALMIADAPDAPPRIVAEIRAPGGIVLDGDGEVYVGTGNGVTGLLPALGRAGIVRVNLRTGAVQRFATGLSMANGVVRSTEGAFYASDDLAQSLDRVTPEGRVERRWLRQTANGLALSADERTLFATRLLPGAVLAIDLATRRTRTLDRPADGAPLVLLDGLTRGTDDALYAAVFWPGEVWRVDPRGGARVIARGLRFPSAVVQGRTGRGFLSTSLYATSFAGRLYEIPGVFPASS